MSTKTTRAVTGAGLLITLGIVFGDIGTSPLYVMKAIIGLKPVSQALIYGGISCVFWTLTLQTTFKYVILTLQADNNGEGGIFSLYTLIRRRAGWLIIPAMIGGAALLADGIITPPISVSSAIEGLRILYPDLSTVPIVIGIITGIFLLQSFGTEVVGKIFGPFMLLWFGMLGSLGAFALAHNLDILSALNPVYAYELLAEYPGGFWLLGAVFLCTTGAEALYSDLGHCGRPNVRVSWAFVKVCLLLNYLGQGAWIMQMEGESLTANPFYGIMPSWFLLPGIVIATMAAIIASQALISGSFTLISEATRLNLWPRVRIQFPTNLKGQIYVPSTNRLLWLGCVGVVLYFHESANMEAAYGLAITLAMLSTTILLCYYLYIKLKAPALAGMVFVFYSLIEGAFLAANLEKFPHGGWVALLIATLLLGVMYVWIRAYEIKMGLAEDVRFKKYLSPLKELSADESVPKFATHLVYMTSAQHPREIENKIMYSIFQKRPKRADVYWFVHVTTTDSPFTMEYKVRIIAPQDVVRIDFKLGFRVEQRINLFFRKVVEELVANGEVNITSRYDSLSRHNVIGDFRFVVLEKFLSYENDLPYKERKIMEWYFFIKQFVPSEREWFGLDTSDVTVEKVPLVIRPHNVPELKRIN